MTADDEDAPPTLTLRAHRSGGWHYPKGAQAAHYLRGGVSLCGRWVCHPSVIVSPRAALATDCAACRNSLGSKGGPPAA